MRLLANVGAVLSAVSLAAVPNLALPNQASAAPRLHSGFSTDRLARIDDFYEAKVRRQEMAGIVLLIARHGRIVHFRAIGYANTRTRNRLTTDSIFRLHSMTKPITAASLMMLYEKGRFRLSDPVSRYIPELKGLRALRTRTSSITDTVPAEREPTIHDLLRFTDGFSSGLRSSQNSVDAAYLEARIRDPDVSLEEMMKRVARIPLLYQPGSTVGYGIASDIQARLVEILSGESFDAFIKERIFDPLRMRDTGFGINADAERRLVAVHWSKDHAVVPAGEEDGYPRPQNVLYEPSQINAYSSPGTRIRGSGGLVGTAEDYWRFAQMMANGGVLNGTRILSPNTVRYMIQDHRSFLFGDRAAENAQGWSWGLGFAIMTSPARAEFMGSKGSFFWHGAAGTTFWVDPEKDLVVVALTQHLGSDKSDLETLIPEVRALVYGALLE